MAFNLVPSEVFLAEIFFFFGISTFSSLCREEFRKLLCLMTNDDDMYSGVALPLEKIS